VAQQLNLVCKLASACGRVVNVSSVMHRGGKVTWKNPAGMQHYSPLAVYAQSKLALTMYKKSLSETAGASFNALSMHPGVFATRLLPVYGHMPADRSRRPHQSRPCWLHPRMRWSTAATTTVLSPPGPRRWSKMRAPAGGLYPCRCSHL
jgi:NAD(P)-dependent dehydrogenase (short-subunit alcohol dehydrogenase family)